VGLMRHAIFLAVQSLWWHRGRSITIVLCLTLTLWLPVTVRILLQQFRSEITTRATSTPLVIGAPGSRIDLVLHTLYFESAPPSTTTMGEVNFVQDTGFASAIPIHAEFRTQNRGNHRGAPIVGTTPEYLEFRNLSIQSGRMFATLGECVVGAGLAQQLQLKTGDTILSAPRNAFDLAGDYPLKLQVVGVLNPGHSADDGIVLTDIQTVWIIQGIGHGHQDLSAVSDESLVLSRESGMITGSSAVLPFLEITPENIDSFHFHGEPETFPVTSIIAVTDSARSSTLLQGRYASARKTAQCLAPPTVVNELLTIVFRVEQLLWFSSLISGIVTLLLLGLVTTLSVRLRAEEMRTMFQLGCSRGTIAKLLTAELLVLLGISSLTAVLAAWITHSAAARAMHVLLF
jgi:putative ABC transport system permease protein